MNDTQIIDLFFMRDEQAIRESMNAYGNYCRAVSASVLHDPADVEEVVADTWLKAWETIPPQRPQHLRLFLGKITRNLALSLWRRNHAYRRGGGQVALALEELGDCVPSGESAEEWVNMQELEKAITSFLKQETQIRRAVFLRRYFYLEEISAIARRYDLKESNVRMMLTRTRQKLKKYLMQEGYIL